MAQGVPQESVLLILMLPIVVTLIAFFAACLAEPSLVSLGGGGYLMAHTKDNDNLLYDFFVQTPGQKKDQAERDFYPVEVDFGGAVQVFHIGMASSAVPGGAKGIFQIQSELGKMPIEKVIEPAVKFAREGIAMNWFSSFKTSMKDKKPTMLNKIQDRIYTIRGVQGLRIKH